MRTINTNEVLSRTGTGTGFQQDCGDCVLPGVLFFSGNNANMRFNMFHRAFPHERGICFGITLMRCRMVQVHLCIKMCRCQIKALLIKVLSCSIHGFSLSCPSLRKMVLSIHPDLQDNHRADLGETYMGNPGVHLPWDVKHLVEYPWAGDHCSAPKPLYSDPSQACYDQFKHQSQGMQVQCPAEPEDTHLLGDGKGCTGLCGVTSTDAPCSCGTMSCPGCVSGFGFALARNSSQLSSSDFFVSLTPLPSQSFLMLSSTLGTHLSMPISRASSLV